MKICICCSLSFGDEVREIAQQLEEMGHEVLLPNGVINRLIERKGFDPILAKITTDSNHKHVDKVREADAVLVCNFTKNDIENYIGANSFAEMFTAYYFDKPIYTLNPLPNMPYINDEIHSFNVKVLDGDLEKIGEAKMRLFLASQDLGNFATVLKKIIGNKRRALIISNARDYYQDEARIETSLEKTFVNLEKIDIEARRLDLHRYFGETDRLANLLTEYDPGLIFAIGGNVYCLATALAMSGMDDLIRQGLEQDLFVYGGYSAGAMVTANALSLYQVKVKPGEEQSPDHIAKITREIYGVKPEMRGLGTISQYIAPHMNHEDYIDTMNERLENIKHAGAKAILLNDSDVYIVNGDKREVLKGE